MNELSSTMTFPVPAGGSLRGLLTTPPEFVDLLPVAAYACDSSGRVLWFNRLAAALWGRRPTLNEESEKFCGAFRLFLEGREIAREETPMAHALRTGVGVEGAEVVIERPDGSRIWAMVHIAPVKDEAGRVIGAINCFHDTTELHRVSDKLRETHEQLDDFFENSAVPLHIVSSDGRILRANIAELNLLGYEADEYIGRHIAEFHADPPTIADILARLSRGEELKRYPARLKCKDGRIKHIVITSSGRMRDGDLVNTRCFTEDVTAELEAKQKATDAEDRFRQLIEALPAAIYTTDNHGRITYYNRAAVELSGREPELGTDKWCVTWRLYFPDGTPMAHEECPMALALKEGRPIRNVEALAERPDGIFVPFIPFPTPLRDRSGKLTGAVNMLIDISERKQAESRQIVLLKELNHRVKNNMQMLQALLTSAQRETTNSEARAVLDNASRRIAAMAAAQQVLYGEMQPTSFSTRDFLEAVCSTIQSTLSTRVRIVIEDAPGELSNDVAMPLALILNELLINAVKHGTVGGAIRVGIARRDQVCSLWVHDDGPGFELDASTRRRSSGLGLVTGLSRQIGGSFSVERDGGARCIVSFEERPSIQ